MTAIEIYPQLGQELVLDANDWYVSISLGDITIYIPGDNPEKRADWLMGFWEQLTDYMANHTDPTHLTNRVQKVCLGCGQDNGNWQNWPCPTTRALEDSTTTHAGYTSHGHPIAGLKQSGKPSSVMRCGGPRICARCALEASAITTNSSGEDE